MQTMATRGASNERLRHARGTRTQAELAELANDAIYRATGRIGSLSAKAISDLECGLYTWPAKQTRDALCAVLGVPDARDLGFAPRRRSRGAQSLPLPPMTVPAETGRPPDVTAIRAVSESLQAADRQLGGGHLYPSVVGYLRSQIAPALAIAADQDGTDLFAAAASFSEIAGWMSHDGGDDRRADRHFTQALRFARAADRPAVVGNVQASMSHLSVHLGRSRDAVQLAEDGITHAQPHHPLVARLHAMRARGLAALGYTGDSRAALADAERALTKAEGALRGDWTSDFDSAALASETAWCLHRLGDLDAAEKSARDAIALRSGDRVRSRSFAQLALAQVLLAANRIDEAANLAEQVRTTAVTLTSARVRTQLVDVAAALRPHRSVPAVSGFLDSAVGITASPTLIEDSV